MQKTSLTQPPVLSNTQNTIIRSLDTEMKTDKDGNTSNDKNQLNNRKIFNSNNRLKKHKRKVRKHSPQYYQQLKLVKLNLARQSYWDNRFILQTIPNIAERKKIKTSYQTRNKSPIIQIKQKQKAGLPLINKKKNIVLDKKQGVDSIIDRKFAVKNEDKVNQSEYQTIQHKHPKNRSKTHTKNVTEIQDSQFINQIEDSFTNHKFAECHKNFLLQITKKCDNKKIKIYLQKQLELLNNRTSSIYQVVQAIEKREIQINKLKEIYQQANKIGDQYLESYRLATLFCIQQLLKWRQSCQNIYQSAFKKIKSIQYMHEGKNYLLKIGQDLSFIEKQLNTKQLDPFLLSVENKIQNSQLLKIRACELLLLQQRIIN